MRGGQGRASGMDHAALCDAAEGQAHLVAGSQGSREGKKAPGCLMHGAVNTRRNDGYLLVPAAGGHVSVLR